MALTIVIGFLVTALNLNASNLIDIAQISTFSSMAKMEIDLINSVFALFTAIITIVYIYFQIKKIRIELKSKSWKKDTQPKERK